MRIVAGKARGMRLEAPAGETTRPTSERAKEAIFSMLQFDLAGRRVLDLFAGSGQMAMEALSRGAESAVLVERDKAAQAVIAKNLARTRLLDAARLVKGEALSFLSSYRGEPFHLVFLDPPYAAGLLPRVLRALLAGGLLTAGATVVAECRSRADLFGGDAELEAAFRILKSKRYGIAEVLFLTPAGEESPVKETAPDVAHESAYTHAIVPGSFDPITNGHLDVITRARALADRVTVAVMMNEAKTYTFTLAERAEMARRATAHIDGVSVVASEGMLTDLFEAVGADVIVKGVRNEKDRTYEEEMARANLLRNPRAKTLLLDASDAVREVSSTAVRACLSRGEGAEALLPPAVAEYIKERESTR